MKNLLLLILLLSVLSSHDNIDIKKQENSDIKVNTHFNISKLSEEEFQYVGTKGIETATIDNFRKVEFLLEVEHSDDQKNREITIPDFKEISNSYDIERYWYGNSEIEDNSNKTYCRYVYRFIILTNVLSEEQIKDIYSSEEVKITWGIKSNDKEIIYKLRDLYKTTY